MHGVGTRVAWDTGGAGLVVGCDVDYGGGNLEGEGEEEGGEERHAGVLGEEGGARMRR